MTLSPIEIRLFDHNLYNVAKRFNLIDGDVENLSSEDATSLLNLAEELSFDPSDEKQLRALYICALLWENRHSSWLALGPFISRVLIRMGLSTTAKMTGWDANLGLFNSFGSLVEELASTIQLMSHEVSIGTHKVILSDFQKRMWDGIDRYARIGISAPTSAGKSFVLVNKAICSLQGASGKVFYIVPTISLITQVSNDLRKTLKSFGITDIDVAQTVNDISLFRSDKVIYVLTQERAFSALNHPDADLSSVKLLIVDEIQNIEKVSQENEERSKILLDVIQIFKNDVLPEKIVVSGPRLKNISSVIKSWFGESAESITENLPAVINITYSLKTGRNKLFFTQYIDNQVQQQIEIDDKFSIKDKILKRQKFDSEEIDFITQIIKKNRNDGNLVFASTTSVANSIAKSVAEKLDSNDISHETDSFIEFIGTTVHPKYELIEAAKKGVAYHHSKMPIHIRSLVERLFAERHLSTIVSTTTLMQGVNLPAKNIIIKTPSVGGEGETLTGYEFANLKGRAGRLMKDFVGRSFIINEKACGKAGIDLKVADSKDLKVGFAKKFIDERDYIQEALFNNIEANKENNSDLITYIRNMTIRYPESFEDRLKEVGIQLSQDIIDKNVSNLQQLQVPKQICINNFYWDPITLNKLYVSVTAKEWPEIPINIVFSTNPIKDCIIKMASFAPLYYNRYLPNMEITENSKNKILSLCIFAESYGRGNPLKDVINPVRFPIRNGEDIEDRINDIQTKVVYGIPKLLKPLFQINDIVKNQNTASVLSFIEMGGVDQRLRLLIEVGIPRETAIEMLQTVPASGIIDSEGSVNESALITFLKSAYDHPSLNKWHKLLIRDIV